MQSAETEQKHSQNSVCFAIFKLIFACMNHPIHETDKSLQEDTGFRCKYAGFREGYRVMRHKQSGKQE